MQGIRYAGSIAIVSQYQPIAKGTFAHPPGPHELRSPLAADTKLEICPGVIQDLNETGRAKNLGILIDKGGVYLIG